jgi:hypothetical protein
MTRSRDLIKLAVERLERNLKSQPSHADEYEKWLKEKKLLRYDSHTQKISVTLDFCVGRISKVKIIASYQEWVDIYYTVDQQTFDSIQNFLYRCPKQKKQELKNYAENDLKGFREDLFTYAIAANIDNPAFYCKKKMRSSPYGFTPKERFEVSNMTVRLYVYLRHDIARKKREQWPFYVKGFLKKYDIPTTHLDTKIPHRGKSEILKIDVEQVILAWYGLEKLGDRFWKTFVEESRISRKRVRKMKRINPDEDPFLKELFKEFKK